MKKPVRGLLFSYSRRQSAKTPAAPRSCLRPSPKKQPSERFFLLHALEASMAVHPRITGCLFADVAEGYCSGRFTGWGVGAAGSVRKF